LLADVPSNHPFQEGIKVALFDGNINGFKAASYADLKEGGISFPNAPVLLPDQ
jgi:hypothetical protein